MEISIFKQNEENHLAINGRVDTINAAELEKQINPFFENSGETLVLDCENMSYISSTGLRVILLTHKKITANGGKFILRNLSVEVRSIFDMTGFSRILTIE